MSPYGLIFFVCCQNRLFYTPGGSTGVWKTVTSSVTMSFFYVKAFSPNWPTGPIRPSNCDVRSCVSLFVGPLPAIFCVDWGGEPLVRGLVQRVPRPCAEP